MTSDSAEEYFDIVDREGVIISRALRSECHGNPELIHRTVHILICNSSGDMLLQKRARSKDIQPGKWDTAVGGHVDAGESVEQAVVRELQEEMGIALPLEKLKRLYTYFWESPVETELVTTFYTEYNQTPVFQASEIDAVRYWPLDEIRTNFGTGVFTPNFELEFGKFEKRG